MDTNDLQSKQLTVVESVVDEATPAERELLLSWAQELQRIRNSNDTMRQKCRQAVVATRSRKAMAPLLKLLARELKRIGWDDRTWIGRLGWAGVLIALATVGGGTGGFAAFGTAIAVPLWLVAGGGGIVLGTLIETLKARLSKGADTQTTSVIKRG